MNSPLGSVRTPPESLGLLSLIDATSYSAPARDTSLVVGPTAPGMGSLWPNEDVTEMVLNVTIQIKSLKKTFSAARSWSIICADDTPPIIYVSELQGFFAALRMTALGWCALYVWGTLVVSS